MKKKIGERLEDERVRLGKKKGEMAALGGVVNSAYTNYLEGKRSPDAEFLSLIADAGADVQYILTGIRTNAAVDQPAGYALTPREEALIGNYRGISDEGDKRIVERTAQLAVEAIKDDAKQEEEIEGDRRHIKDRRKSA